MRVGSSNLKQPGTDRVKRPPRSRRSVLVYSALAIERWSQAMNSGADLVLFDLEDGTAQSRKDEARAGIIPCFGRPDGSTSPLRHLRINSPRSPEGLRDLLAIVDCDHPPDGIVIPKVSHPEEICWVGDVLGDRHPQLELIALIENQAGLRWADENRSRKRPLGRALSRRGGPERRAR